MTRRYKVELYCRITAFYDLEVEADSAEQAKTQAISDAKQLGTHDWDLQEIEDIDTNCEPYEIEENAE